MSHTEQGLLFLSKILCPILHSNHRLLYWTFKSPCDTLCPSLNKGPPLLPPRLSAPAKPLSCLPESSWPSLSPWTWVTSQCWRVSIWLKMKKKKVRFGGSVVKLVWELQPTLPSSSMGNFPVHKGMFRMQMSCGRETCIILNWVTMKPSIWPLKLFKFYGKLVYKLQPPPLSNR